MSEPGRVGTAAGSSASRRSSIKALKDRAYYHDKRRAQLLQRQKEARRDLTNHARGIALNDPVAIDQSSDEDASRGLKSKAISKGKEAKLKLRRDYWCCQLCTPEWMTDVPSDLSGTGREAGEGKVRKH